MIRFFSYVIECANKGLNDLSWDQEFTVAQNEFGNGEIKIKFKFIKKSKITFRIILPKSLLGYFKPENAVRDIDNGVKRLDYTPLKIELRKVTQSILNYAQ